MEKSETREKLFINTSWEGLIKEAEIVAQYIQYWGELYGSAQAAVVMADSTFASWKAKMLVSALESAKVQGGRLPSVDVLKSAYRADGAYLEYAHVCAEAEGRLKSAMGTYNAFRAKADLINTLIRTMGQGHPTEESGTKRTPFKKG